MPFDGEMLGVEADHDWQLANKHVPTESANRYANSFLKSSLKPAT